MSKYIPYAATSDVCLVHKFIEVFDRLMQEAAKFESMQV